MGGNYSSSCNDNAANDDVDDSNDDDNNVDLLEHGFLDETLVGGAENLHAARFHF